MAVPLYAQSIISLFYRLTVTTVIIGLIIYCTQDLFKQERIHKINYDEVVLSVG